MVENDLVAARQTDRSVGSQDLSRYKSPPKVLSISYMCKIHNYVLWFHRLLTMARMMSVSYGETTLSLEHWQMVLELERLRKERLK